jgi:D-sedoheptulose 7-phosphate isomerase
MEVGDLADFARHHLVARNSHYGEFFAREADRLAIACREMSERFLHGGRLIAFGRGAYATDAQHVSVEFVHPVIVGKRALPALDASTAFQAWVETVVRPEDIVMGFGPPGCDPDVCRALASAAGRGAMTLALPGRDGDYAVDCFSADPFQHQEMIEILYHTLWETVHVFFEHRELDCAAGSAGFLYPFLGGEKQSTGAVLSEVATSIRAKVAEEAALRERAAAEESGAIAEAAIGIAECIERGGKLLIFGNGGSATDANDWAIDCISPPQGLAPVPAVSLSAEPAVLSALANDVGTDVVFQRQVIAQAGPHDAAVGISTSGGSRNVIAALAEARKRGLVTVALLGYDGGEIVRQALVDFPVVVHCDYIPRIQEVQASIYHVIREMLGLVVESKK